MKGPIESLGKANKIFLVKYFGFHSIRWAKHRLGVDNDKQAYDIMKEVYNGIATEKKEALLKEKRIEKRAKMRFLNVMEEIENRKKVFNVVVTITARKTIKKTNHSFPITTDEVKTILASNETQLDNLIDSFLSERYPYEDSYEIQELIRCEYNISSTSYKPLNALDVHMKRAKPVKASFLKYSKNIDPVSYVDFKGECVLKILMEYMDIKKEKTLVADFNGASLTLYGEPYDKQKGVSARMILHMCQQRNISCLGFDQRDKNFVKYTADQNRKRKFRPIVFYMFMAHFYLITDSNTILSISATFRQNNNVFHSSLEVGDKSKENEDLKFYSDLSVAECLELPENSVVIYDKPNLNDELRDYIRLTNDIPKVKNHTITQVGEILLDGKIKLVINNSQEYKMSWQTAHDLCNKANIKFNNQAIGQLLCEIRDKFFQAKRAKFTPDEREQIKKEQGNKCAICKCELVEKYQIDHIEPLASGGTNGRENLQALCVSCHNEKSREEKEACEYILSDNITSAFNIQSLNVIESDWFRKVAFSQPIGNIDENMYRNHSKFSKDKNKCRRNILLHYGADFARYSVLDDIEAFDGKLTAGFYYVETDNTFPMRQNGFYSLPMILYCLEKYIITTDNIKYQFKPSFTIPADYFREFVEHLDKIFYLEHLDEETNKDLKKIAVNSLIGLFGRRKNTFVENRICDRNEEEDIACAFQDFYKPYVNVINDDIIQVASQSEIKKIESMFPIHAQIVDCEAIELHKLVEKIKEHGGIPYQVKTDAVNYYALEPVDFDKPVISVIRNNDYRVRQKKTGEFIKEKIIRDEEGNIIEKIVTEHKSREEADEKIFVKIEPNNKADNYWDSECKIPKYKDEEAKDLRKAVYINNCDKFELEKCSYKKVKEQYDFTDLAEYILNLQKGCLILGPAGAGKSFLINMMKSILEKKNIHFKAVAPTNKATLEIGGETLHKFSYGLLNSKKQLKKFSAVKYLFLDEISMVPEIFYQVLMMLKHYNSDLKIIISGDFHQLPPVNDRVNKNYEATRALYELVDGNKLELTKCKRSDDTHFKNCMNVRNGKEIDLQKFKPVDETYLNISFTNKCRIKINHECMERFIKENKPDKMLKYETLTFDKNSQDITIAKGMPVIARINHRKLDIVNNESFTIANITDDAVYVSNELKKDIEIPVDKFNRLFYLAFCITIHKSQGATFKQKYTIHEWNKQARRMRYVAISRATEEKNVQIVA